MKYTMKAIETKYKGFVFRSRLEAKWAVMFDMLGWKWDYEPIDFNGWIPDFVIYGKHPTYVEVKPVIEFPQDIAIEITQSGCRDDCLILGQSCLLPDSQRTSFYSEGLTFGWVTEFFEDEEEGQKNAISNAEYTARCWWEPATFGRWSEGKGSIGFCHSVGSFVDRITGCYDGGSFGCKEVKREEIESMWAESHNATRWMRA